MRRSGGGMLFTLVVSAALVLGAGTMALVLLGSGAPDALAVGLVLASLPVGPLVACYVWLDRYEPEPAGLLLAAFGWGALVATAAAILVQQADSGVTERSLAWSAVAVAPVTEEAFKGLFVVLLLVARRHELHGVLDGLVYAGLVGVGFAFTENILYFMGAYLGDGIAGGGGLGAATDLFVLRGVFSPFAHPLFTSAIGVGVGVAVASSSRGVRLGAPLAGYLLAVFLHALWNGSAFFEGGALFVLTYLFAMVPAVVLLVGLALWVRVRERRMLSGALEDLARRGLVPYAELPWLVGLPGRRAARRYAAAYGGPSAATVMRELQQDATELAFLHHRWLRGDPPPHFAARGADLLGRIGALRRHTVFPQLPGRLVVPGAAVHPGGLR